MRRSTVPSRSTSLLPRHLLRHLSHLSRLLMGGGLALSLSLTACGKKEGEGTKAPGGGDGAASTEEVEAAVARAKQEAKVSQLIEIANKDLKAGRYVSASNVANEALEENPDNADAYAVLGAAKWRAGDFAGSTDAYRKALEIDDKNFGAALGLARNLQMVGQYDEAAALQDVLLADDKEQLDPWLTKLWSHYATCDAKKSVETVDAIFPLMGKKDPALPLVQAYAAFMRAFEDQGPMCVVEGDTGKSTLGLHLGYGLKFSGAVAGDEYTPVVFLETREEAVIDEGFVKTLGLKELAKYKPPGSEEEVGLVLIPELKFGDLKLKNIPATVQPLEAYAEATGGETPGVILGRQAIHGLGTITFDFPGGSLELAKEAPAGPADGEVELPMMLLSMNVLHAPIVPISIDGSDHSFYAYLGFTNGSGLSVTKKHYLKSGHLPRELEPLDDPNAGLKMVYVDSIDLGDLSVAGTSGLVLTNEPADATLDLLLRNTAFEVGGHVNLSLMRTWRVTYALGQGKVYIKPS